MAVSILLKYSSSVQSGGGSSSSGSTVTVAQGDIFLALTHNAAATSVNTPTPTLVLNGTSQTPTLITTASTAGATPTVRLYTVTSPPVGTYAATFGFTQTSATNAVTVWYQISGGTIQSYVANNGTGTTATFSLANAPSSNAKTILARGATNANSNNTSGTWTTDVNQTPFYVSHSDDANQGINASVTFSSSQTWSGIYIAVAEPRFDTIGPVNGSISATSSGSTAWSNTNNAFVSDDTYATVTPKQTSTDNTYLDITGFNVGIPSAGTLYGIVAEVEAKTDGASTIDTIQLLKGGSPVGNVYSPGTLLTSSDTFNTFSNGLWGTSLTASDVNSSDFGVRLRFKGGSATTVTTNQGNNGLTYSVSTDSAAATSQPSGTIALNPNNRIAMAATAITVGSFDTNIVDGATLTGTGGTSTTAGAGVVARTDTAAGKALSFRKQAYRQTATLANTGTKSFVEFWYGYPSSDQGNYGTGVDDPTFVVGSSNNASAIVTRLGVNHKDGNDTTSWGALYHWGDTFYGAGETLTYGTLTMLVVVRRQDRMELWRDGVLKRTIYSSPQDIGASTFILSSFIADNYWTSSSDMVCAGRSLIDPTNAEIQELCANPNVLFKGNVIPWSNTNNALTADNVGATQVPSLTLANNGYLKFSNFGFNLPSNAVPTKNNVTFRRRYSGGTTGSIQTSTFQTAYNNALLTGSNSTGTAWSSAFADESASLTVSGTWTPAMVNDPTYGFWIRAANLGNTATSNALLATSGASTGTESIAWVNPNNATAQDAVYANFTLNGSAATTLTNHQALTLTGYGFNIPTGSVINGLVISIRRARSGGTTGEARFGIVQFMKAGVPGGTNLATSTAFPTTAGNVTFGSNGSLSGNTFTAEDINNANFGLYIKVQGSTATTDRVAQIDSASITVSYNVPGDRIGEVDSASMSVTYTIPDSTQVTYVDSVRVYAQTQGAPLFASLMNELESVSSAVQRKRTVASNIAEAIAYSFALSVAHTAPVKKFDLSINEVETIVSTMMRQRGYVLSINEVETIAIDALTRGRALAENIIENESINTNVSRTRNIATIINEVELISVLLSRIRSAVFSINENEGLVESLTRLRSLMTLVSETYSMSVNSLSRIRSSKATVNSTEGVMIAASRLRAIQEEIAEFETEIFSLTRARTNSLLINELETIGVQLARLRNMSPMAINEVETFNFTFVYNKIKTLALAIAETETMSITMSRTVRMALLISELEGVIAKLNRHRSIKSTIEERQLIDFTLQRIRETKLTINEVEEVISKLSRSRINAFDIKQIENISSFELKRLRGSAFNVDEVETLVLLISAYKQFGFSFDEVETILSGFTRQRGFTPSIEELETLSLLIERARQTAASINEVENISTLLARKRNSNFNVDEKEQNVISALSRRRFSSALIVENLNHEVRTIERLRGLTAALPEHESYVASVKRARDMVLVAVEKHQLKLDLGRFRAVVTEIIEAQDVTAGSIRRIREIASDIAETYSCEVKLTIFETEPGKLTLTASFEEWVVKSDGTLDLQSRSLTWDIVRRVDQIELDVPLAQTIVLDIPLRPENTPDIDDLINAGLKI